MAKLQCHVPATTLLSYFAMRPRGKQNVGVTTQKKKHVTSEAVQIL